MLLNNGSIIGITCPSGYLAPDKVSYAKTVLEGWGFRVRLGATVGNEFHYFSGTDEERRRDLQAMLDDDKVDAILMGRGGYGMSRIIDRLDFAAFLRKPKWLCGFSDVTALHSHVQANFHIPTLHSPMCGHFKPETEHEPFLRSIHTALMGGEQKYVSPPGNYNRLGSAAGILTGGNLSLLVHLIGTHSDVDMTAKLLFIEDLGEHLYHIDRMMLQLKRAGKLSGLNGLIVGGFTDLKDTERPFGQVVEEIIMDKVAAYNYPVCFHFPCGHQEVNYALALGVRHELVVDGSGGTLLRN